jgi:predicted nucleic acid-binding protein
MTTAIDTNVLAAMFTNASGDGPQALRAFRQAEQRGPVIIAAPVYAELLATPGSAIADVNAFLRQSSLLIDWQMTESMWHTAATAYRGYAERRRAQRNDPGPRRILTDFIIGAHAAHVATAFLTFDTGIYRASFPSLTIIRPGAT